MEQTIRDVMHRGVVTCMVTANVAEVAKTMLDNEVSAVVVTDERLDVCGVVTKTDLITCYGEDLLSITAEQIMSGKVLAVSPETPVHEAVQQMLTNKVHQLVILSGSGVHRRPVGIFTSGDAVALMAGRPGRHSAGQMRCADCIRRLLRMGTDGGAGGGPRPTCSAAAKPTGRSMAGTDALGVAGA